MKLVFPKQITMKIKINFSYKIKGTFNHFMNRKMCFIKIESIKIQQNHNFLNHFLNEK